MVPEGPGQLDPVKGVAPRRAVDLGHHRKGRRHPQATDHDLVERRQRERADGKLVESAIGQ